MLKIMASETAKNDLSIIRMRLVSGDNVSSCACMLFTVSRFGAYGRRMAKAPICGGCLHTAAAYYSYGRSAGGCRCCCCCCCQWHCDRPKLIEEKPIRTKPSRTEPNCLKGERRRRTTNNNNDNNGEEIGFRNRRPLNLSIGRSSQSASEPVQALSV